MLSVVVAAAALTLLGTAVPAHAEGQQLQEQIDAILTTYPGGTQIAPNEISWENGAVVLTISSEVQSKAVGSCATGKYCIYSGAALTGSKLTFTDCDTSYSTSALPGSVRSVANARSSGAVQARNSSNSVLATIAAGNSLASAPTGISNVRCTS